MYDEGVPMTPISQSVSQRTHSISIYSRVSSRMLLYHIAENA